MTDIMAAKKALLVRDVDAETIRRLKSRAARKGRSLQLELRDLLRHAVRGTGAKLLEESASLRQRYGPVTIEEIVSGIRADRDR